MKLHLELDGKVLDYEIKPMRSSRFRALCQLAAAGLYVALVRGVATRCGFLGVLSVGVFTLFIAMMKLMDC